MGMFDSFYAADGQEWQTKALGCSLDQWHEGDRFDTGEASGAFQIEVFDYDHHRGSRWSWVTVANGIVQAVDVPRDHALFALAYGGGPAIGPDRPLPGPSEVRQDVKSKPVPHDHRTRVPGCFRCDLTEDEL